MSRLSRLIFLLILLNGCIEPYEFAVKNNEPSLVVEGYISNVSFNESLQYPSDGRYFTVKLRYTSDVSNVRDKVISSASVSLQSDVGEEWNYTESLNEPGTYLLADKDFEAIAGNAYKLSIALPDGNSFESEWAELPMVESAPVGEIGFEEVERQMYKMVAGEEVIQTVQGVDVFVNVPENPAGSPVYYRWDFDPTWIYIAPLARSSQPEYKCWATNEGYLSHFVLQEDETGGYRKNLFFMETLRNERIFEGLSVLVKQYSVSEDFYFFWKEMQEQVGSGGMFDDTPPYNLQTNLKSLDGDQMVYGFFGVVEEKARRWTFSIEELSYFVVKNVKADCLVPHGPGPPAPSCTNCLEYHNGTATNVEPVWWRME